MNSPLLLVIFVAMTSSKTAPSTSLNFTPSGGDPEFRDAANNSRAELVRTKTSDRQGRMLNPLNMFSSIPTSCRYDDTRTGTCMEEFECTAAGGRSTKNGECKRGACCLLERTCGGVVRHNNTYFVRTDIPQYNVEKDRCNLVVDVGPDAPKSCFLRLDFENFELRGPGENGTCEEFLGISAGRESWRAICGSNNGSHIYIYTKRTELEESGMVLGFWDHLVPISDVHLTFAGTISRRHWRIKVSYIDCDKAWAPKDPECDQYYEGVSGAIKSFNYRESNPEQSIVPRVGYNVCIRQEANTCYIKWTSDFFSLDRGSALLITAATNLTDGINFETLSLFSKGSFGWRSDSTSSSAVYSASTPFRLSYYCEGEEIRYWENFHCGKGFSLRYTQLPCNKESPQAAQRENSTQIVANIKVSEGLEVSEG